MPSLSSFPESSLVLNEVKKYLNASLIASIYFSEALCYAKTIIRSYDKGNDNGMEKNERAQSHLSEIFFSIFITFLV